MKDVLNRRVQFSDSRFVCHDLVTLVVDRYFDFRGNLQNVKGTVMQIEKH